MRIRVRGKPHILRPDHLRTYTRTCTQAGSDTLFFSITVRKIALHKDEQQRGDRNLSLWRLRQDVFPFYFRALARECVCVSS